ncbi:hypothetical protein SAMN05444166_4007 [Singulisphaera sp. GP187]|uniref:hypothetical protein n=1 Tax=Singulisphaera sp. GP187 TaxID=1882752 RepID=UPI000925D5C4|nr:hypothetical protein [Singulisphaera sp. GP187]SIO35098.1 hypothetical protein SAMN05444166_4007 [Singulisphaera sp. GP187]
MNEIPDPLETELRAFRPTELSTDLKRRVADRLAGSTTKMNRRFGRIALAGGLTAAACLLALLLGRGGDRGADTKPAIVTPLPVPPDRPEDRLPSLRAYREALAQSPEALDRLLDRHAVRDHGLDPQLVRTRAFHRPDPEGRALTGEL